MEVNELANLYVGGIRPDFSHVNIEDKKTKQRLKIAWPIFALVGLCLLMPGLRFAYAEVSLKTAAWISPVDRDDFRLLESLGAEIDGVWGDRARIYTVAETLETLREIGFRVSPIPDRSAARTADGYPTPTEIGTILSSLAVQHADICRLNSIGRTSEGRDLWMVRISDNPDAEEDEPGVLFMGGFHGDEPPGTILCLDFIYLLLENYGQDAAITDLVNDLEIWVLPLMNPDGYAAGTRYTSEGADLNRSFPDRIRDPVNTPEGRPTETRLLMNWAFEHSLVLSASFHTGALVVNYSFDADPDPRARYASSPDDALFIEQSLTYASRNPPMSESAWFPDGITNGLAWYPIYGGVQDWFYIWQGCNLVTVEVSDRKILSSSELDVLWEENRRSMLAYLEWSKKGIRGLVTNSQTGEPVAASVRVVAIDHDVYTDPDVGDYHRMLLPGVYDMEIRAAGYYEETVYGISVSDGSAARIDVALDPLKKGDVDGDRNIDLADAIRSLQILAGISVERLHQGADVNGDERIGMAEVLFLLKAIQ